MNFVSDWCVLFPLYIILLLAPRVLAVVKVAGIDTGFCAVTTGEFTEIRPTNLTDGRCALGFPIVNTPEAQLEMEVVWRRLCFIFQCTFGAYALFFAYILLQRINRDYRQSLRMDHNAINNVMINFAIDMENYVEEDSDAASQASTEVAVFQAGGQVATSPGVSHQGLYSSLGLGSSQGGAIANDIGLLLFGLLSSNGSKAQIAAHWMSFANVFITRGIKMPNFSDFRPDLISLLLERARVSSDEEVALAQAGVPDVSNVFKTLSSIFKSEVAQRFVGLLSLLTAIMFYFDSTKSFNVSKFLEIEREYRKKYYSDANDFFTSATQAIDFILTRGRLMYKGEWTEALSLATPYTRFMTKYADLACADGCIVLESSWSKKKAHLAAICRLRDEGKALINMVPKEQVKDVIVANARIAEMLTTHEVRLTSSGLRYAPYAIMLHGESGQAKSTIIAYIKRWAAEALGIPEEDYEAINWANLSDGFDETYWRQWLDIFDDACIQTGKPGELDAVVDAIIRRVNNAVHLVPKAFGDKGKVSYSSQVLMTTTNNLELNLRESAHCPMAVFRRFKTIANVKLKPEFAKADGTLDPAKALRNDGGVVDMWNFTISVPVLSTKGSRMPDFKVIRMFEKTQDFLNYLAEDIRRHDKNQNDLLAGVSSVGSIDFCPMCRANQLLVPRDSCLHAETAGQPAASDPVDSGFIQESLGEVPVAQAMSGFMPKLGSLELYRLVTSAEFRRTYIKRMFFGCLLYNIQELHSMIVHWAVWIVYQFAFCFDASLCSPFLLLMKSWRRTPTFDGLRDLCKRWGIAHYLARRISELADYWVAIVRRVLLTAAGWFLNPAAEQRAQMAIAGTSTNSLFSWFTSERTTRTVALLAIATGMYACLRKVGFVQGFFQSGSSSDDDEKKWTINGPDPIARNPYYRAPEVVPLPSRSSNAMSNSQDPQLEAVVQRNIFYCTIRPIKPEDDKPKFVNCNGVKLKRGRFVVPNHAVIETGPVMVTIRSSGKLADGSKTFELQQSQITRMPEKDLAMFDCNVRVSAGASNLEQYFLSGAPYKGKAKAVTYVRRFTPTDNDDAQYKMIKIGYEPLAESVERGFAMEKISEGYPAPNLPRHYFGGTPTTPTIDGDCGGITIAFLGHNQAPVIVGFHAVAVARLSWPGLGIAGSRPSASYSAAILVEDLEKLHEMHSSQSKFQGDFRILPLTQLPEYHSCVKKTPLQYTNDTHPKCALGYFGELMNAPTESRPACEVIGTLQHHRRQTKTSIVPSPISNYMAEKHHIKSDKVPPRKQPEWIAQRLHIEGVGSENQAYQPAHLVSAAGNAYCQQISAILPESFPILTNHQAVNGIPGELYVDAINGSSSGGIGLEGPKRNYYDPNAEQIEIGDDGQVYVKVQFVKEVYDEVDRFTQAYLNGERAPAIFVAVDKDELLSAKKAAEGKLRQIFTSPLAYTILVRKYLMFFIAFMQTHREQTEVAVGINAMGRQWGGLRDYLTYFGEDTCFAGDFKGFDKSVVSGRILSETLGIIYRLVAPRLPSDDDRLVLSGLLSEMVNPLFDFHGTLVTFNMNPSGNPITVIINCIANSIVGRMVWATLHPSVGILEAVNVMYDQPDDEKRERGRCEILMHVYVTKEDIFSEALASYRDHVHQINYGDDNGYNVSKKAPWFNHTNFAAAASVYRIEYTHADKSDPRLNRIPYQHIDQITFLKRSFVKDPVTGLVMAPLEKASFANMLHWNRKHKLESQESLTASSLHSWILESVQHGKEYYYEVQAIVADVAMQFPQIACHLTKVPGTELYFKTYHEVLESSYGYVPRGLTNP